MQSEARRFTALHRGLVTLLVGGFLTLAVSGVSLAGGGDNETGAQENVMTLTVTQTPAAGQQGQATVTNIPTGGPGSPPAITFVGLYWYTTGGNDGSATQVGTCTTPAGGQATCTFTIPTTGSGYLIAGGDPNGDHDYADDNNDDVESNPAALTIVTPNQLPEAPYAAVLPLLLVGGVLAVRRFRSHSDTSV